MPRVKRHAIPEDGSVNMSPAMDVIFQQCLNAILKTLLIFFIVAASLVIPTRIEVRLPESATGSTAPDTQKLLVSYTLDGDRPVITLDAAAVGSLDELAARMKSRLTGPESLPVDIRIEKTVPYQHVVAIMDAVRDAGYPKFSLLTLAKNKTESR